MEHLAARGDQAVALRLQRQKLQKRLAASRLFGGLHLFLFNHQRDDARAAERVALFHGRARRNHHLTQAVDCAQMLQIDQQQAVYIRDQLDFALLRLGGMHVRSLADFPQDIRRVVFMQHVFVVFPDIDALLAHAEQNRDVLLCNDMALAEDRSLFYTPNDLGAVVAEHLPDRVLCFHQFHRSSSCSAGAKYRSNRCAA